MKKPVKCPTPKLDACVNLVPSKFEVMLRWKVSLVLSSNVMVTVGIHMAA